LTTENAGFIRPGVGLERRAALFVVVATVLGAAAYAALYFPYAAGSFPVRVLSGYLRLVARAAAAGIRSFDRSVKVHGDLVEGHFALRIVLDCAALDAHALYGAAVLAFPAPWRYRMRGLVLGTAVVASANIVRIVLLYGVGLWWPSAFQVLHEEVLQLGIVLVAFLTFLGWILWVHRFSRQ
jgi:exosortase/archaeosortase family protein